MTVSLLVSNADPVDIMVGLRIRKFRRERKLTQERICREMGVTFQQVQRYERGINRISASMLVRVAKALAVQPGDLLPSIDIGAPVSSIDKLSASETDALVAVFRALDGPDKRQELLSFARKLGETPRETDVAACVRAEADDAGAPANAGTISSTS
jgi:transcriptional regulator with XRE-family HTH domain